MLHTYPDSLKGTDQHLLKESKPRYLGESNIVQIIPKGESESESLSDNKVCEFS